MNPVHETHGDFQHATAESERPILVGHFLHTIGSYVPAILLFLAAIGIAYTILAALTFLAAPATKTTMQSFRLDFEGAGEGLYPNKSKFNIADIISGPILTRVYQDNHISNYIGYGEFSRSIFVLESNRQYEQLAAEYQAKLADQRLSLVDRERLQQEFEMKGKSISKNEYAIYFARHDSGHPIPEPLVRKALLDILNTWADFAVNQQHVLAYDVSVLSPDFLAPSTIEQSDMVAAIEILRSKASRIAVNAGKIERLPGAKLARRPKDHGSLEEIRLRVDEIMRFRLEPLLSTVLHTPGLISDRGLMIRFLESQLAYDQRQLDAAQRSAESVREAILAYQQPTNAETVVSSSARSDNQKSPGGVSEAVMPQLSDTFLDRLMSLTGRAADAQYRQNMVDDYRHAIAETIPVKQAVAYDQQMLAELRSSSAGTGQVDRAEVKAEVEQTRQELGQLIVSMNELFQIASRNMTASARLFTLTGSPVTQTLRGVSVSRLALYGILVMLIAIPVIVALCLVHNRVREEERFDEQLQSEQTTTS